MPASSNRYPASSSRVVRSAALVALIFAADKLLGVVRDAAIAHTAGADHETHVFRTADTYRKMVFTADGERLIGAVFVGDITRAGLYRHLIRDHVRLNGLKMVVVGHQLHYGHFLRL